MLVSGMTENDGDQAVRERDFHGAQHTWVKMTGGTVTMPWAPQ